MTRIWTGDYSNGTFSQWEGLHNSTYVWGESGVYGPAWPTKVGHSAEIVPLGGGCGNAARFELRSGERPYYGGGERTEVHGLTMGGSYAPLNSTRWYSFSVKFGDTTFPNIGDSGVSWLTVCQFSFTPTHPTSPVLQFGYPAAGTAGATSGKWYLMQTPSTAVGDGTYTYDNSGVPTLIAEMPVNPGEWHDIKMQATWKSDTSGSVKLWRNGSAQTLLTGGTTFTGKTAIASSGATTISGVTAGQGIYRNYTTTPTMIVYHTGFRMADTEDGL